MTALDSRYFGSSITRQIWCNVENIVLIYVGAAADFALNPDVHWLFFTNCLPSDPARRFIETFAYNQRVFFTAPQDIPTLGRQVRAIHTAVERQRAAAGGPDHIPNRAFIEVNDMLVEYGIRGYEYLHRRAMTDAEKEAYYQDMKAACESMGVTDLDADYAAFCVRREQTLHETLHVNDYTPRLYDSYKRGFGAFRYWVGALFQAHFVHPLVRQRLNLPYSRAIGFLYHLYPHIRSEWAFRALAFVLFDARTRADLFKFKRDLSA